MPEDALEGVLLAHLETCRRCRTLRRHLLEQSGEKLETEVPSFSKEETERATDAGELVAGGVFAIHGPLRDEYLLGVLVEWDEEEAVVVPVSEQVHYATNWDLLLDETLLGYPALAEVWNHGTVVVEQLKERLGGIGSTNTSALLAMYEAALESADVPTGIAVGPPVLDEADPRLLFQGEEGELAAAFWEPATLLAGAETVGELVLLRREDLGLAPSALADLLKSEELGRLEHNSLDIAHRIRVESFVALMKRLAFEPTRRLEGLIERGVEATYRQEAPAFHRRRRGTRRPRVEDGPRRAKEYARAVIAGMQDG